VRERRAQPFTDEVVRVIKSISAGVKDWDAKGRLDLEPVTQFATGREGTQDSER
jgi:hypothetical protein